MKTRAIARLQEAERQLNIGLTRLPFVPSSSAAPHLPMLDLLSPGAPERVVHARGAAAHGTFRLHTAIPELTRAKLFTDTTQETPIFVRFSTVQGSRGSADSVRDVRGFAVR